MERQTLLRKGSPLANPLQQQRVLRGEEQSETFAAALRRGGTESLQATEVEVLQVNLGKLCNMTCSHCHVDAGPDRREIMSQETAKAVLRVLEETGIRTLDLTGGAPEMNPHFRWLVHRTRQLGRHVVDRCNLTILQAPGFDDLPQFLAEHQVEIVASLPCYLEENVDSQRGIHAFQRSLDALRQLNQLGYGRTGSPLRLNLVYNPIGPSLPPPQAALEDAYRKELAQRHQIEFTRLITITNMPISRFLDDLLESGKYDAYMEQLIDAYNPQTVDGLMCRTTLSVDWRGRLYDCDFNQMLDLPVDAELPQTIHDFDHALLAHRAIVVGQHCFGCTAGAGSGCQGAII